MERIVIEGVAVANPQLTKVLARRFGVVITPRRTVVFILPSPQEGPMEITVAMRAHRKLRDRARYRKSSSGDGVPIGDGETPIGVYEHSTPPPVRRLVITDRALYMQDGSGWIVVPYEEMRDVEVEGGDKNADHLEIRLRDGSSVLVPVLGEDDMGRDTYSMLMFLGHVIGDRERRARASGGMSSMALPSRPVPEEHAAR